MIEIGLAEFVTQFRFDSEETIACYGRTEFFSADKKKLGSILIGSREPVIVPSDGFLGSRLESIETGEGFAVLLFDSGNSINLKRTEDCHEYGLMVSSEGVEELH